jgi:hypothetical protein
MAEAQKARHSQIHLGTQPKGNALFHYPDHCPGGLLVAVRIPAVIFHQSMRLLPSFHCSH